MKTTLTIFILCSSLLWASGPGRPPNDPELGLEGIIENSDVVVIGTPSKSSQRHFYKGKEVTEKEAREIFDSHTLESKEPFPRLTTEFTVTVRVSKHLKGAIKNQEMVFQWRDLTGSMCPHIPLSALKEKGIWYTGQHVKKDEHDHAVYWMSIFNMEQIEAALKRAEQGGAGQPATAPESKSSDN